MEMAMKKTSAGVAAKQIAEKAFPGWAAEKVLSLQERSKPLSNRDSAGPRESADSVMPSQSDLEAKYLGSRAVTRDARDSVSDHSDVELVRMTSGPLRKTVAVSKEKKKVVWSQG
jgi:hypothetical protein